MAGLKAPELDLDFSWPLVAALGVIAALVIWVVYEVLVKSGIVGAASSVTGLASSASNAAQNVTDGVSTGIGTLLGTGNQTKDAGGMTNTDRFYQGITNFFTTGSIYGDN